ncbi:DUF2569 family protein [Pararoseomonas indoligenes]|uniref:DUF2569 family protein n=1 Tax=Roseomonas indoligenes TaxID=2820811 RepID=UPI003158167D
MVAQFIPLALVLGIISLAIWFTQQRQRAEEPPGTGLKPGLRGWLAFLNVALWVGSLRSLVEFAKSFADQDPTVAKQFPLLSVADAVIGGLGLVLLVYTAWLLTRQSRRFLAAFHYLAASVVLIPPLSLLLGYLFLNVWYAVPVTVGAVMTSVDAQFVGQWVAGTLIIAAWLMYVRRSRRVAITCVR